MHNTLQEVRLRLTDLGSKLVFNPEIGVDLAEDISKHHWEATFRARALTLDERHWVFKWPASWWQHFKQDCFPEWAKARWPVRYKSQDIRLVALVWEQSLHDRLTKFFRSDYPDVRLLFAENRLPGFD